MKNRLILFCSCLLFYVFSSKAQDSPVPFNPISLDDLSAFQPSSGNWTVVGDIIYDLEGKKAKIESGTGILLNTLQKGENQPLMTAFDHGDIELELEFMMPKGSNSGIYLQGRYEVQLFDSWGKQNPDFSDAGAIYQRWDESRGSGRAGFEGHPPMLNVSKAPGLWQSLRIVFRAPRFDPNGKKIANAKFVSVYQNGVLVQKNVEVTGPTRAAFFEDETPLGPLVIQGDHGGVAIRNINYKSYGSEQVVLSDMKLTSYDSIKKITDFATANPKGTMDIDVLAHLAPASRNEFAGSVSGTLNIPSSGEYFFNLNLAWVPDDTPPGVINGAGVLLIDGKEVVEVDGVTGKANGSAQLTAGDHTLTLNYFKVFGHWYAPSNDILLTVEGKGVAQMALNKPIKAADPVGEISVQVKDQAEMQRGFFMHKGSKRTHTVAVGEPGGANYVMDLSTGALLAIWRGEFVETTPMWYGRGETQLMLPKGALIEFTDGPSVAMLENENQAWPSDSVNYTFESYKVNVQGEPMVHYSIGSARISSQVSTADAGKKLVHQLQVNSADTSQEFWCRLASGSKIEKLSKSLYAIDDKSYYIELNGKESPVIRSSGNGMQELILPLKWDGNQSLVSYSIVW
ncbi:DUF1080 domain-containing protein [Algoriphagus halophytocola]|uniref:3-keto-disaccharide hydrolase n=1 Tax=Algoriphagus halophytocola TaxID=2991499 RepID=UPI0022DDD4D5|nr:DUF1080 domain-containing protein [Algoriphagus sp. TR-M9]WBL44573.1 DUF1080 domain-containing protein [Algoriphagus sp. TR-M9]